MNLNRRFYLLCAELVLLQGVSLFAEEPAGKVSRHIKDAVLVGLPNYQGQISQAPVADSPATEDPDLLVLPVVKVSTPGGQSKAQGFTAPLKTEAMPLVLGTGVTEFKGRKFTVLIPRLFYVPIGFKLKW